MADFGEHKTHVLDRPPVDIPPNGPRAALRCVDISVLQDSGGVRISLDGRDVFVGRGSDNTITLNAESVSRRHARVFLHEGAWHVEDLGSTNGTRVNNSKVDRRALADGDTVAFGRVCYKFNLVKKAAGTATSHDLDLGTGDKTIIVGPGQHAATTPGGAGQDATVTAVAKTPKRDPRSDTGSRARAAAAGSKSGSNTVLWLVVVVAAAALAGGAALALGFI